MIIQNSQFEISKGINIGMKKYRDQKIKVCGKDSILFQEIDVKHEIFQIIINRQFATV